MQQHASSQSPEPWNLPKLFAALVFGTSLARLVRLVGLVGLVGLLGAAAGCGDGAVCEDDSKCRVGALRAGPFACGEDGLTCEGSNEACAGRGNGTCTGDAPGPDGCEANCYQFNCGGMVRCLCSAFECVDLGACSGCDCALKLPGRSSCQCDDSNGTITLECPGA